MSYLCRDLEVKGVKLELVVRDLSSLYSIASLTPEI